MLTHIDMILYDKTETVHYFSKYCLKSTLFVRNDFRRSNACVNDFGGGLIVRSAVTVISKAVKFLVAIETKFAPYTVLFQGSIVSHHVLGLLLLSFPVAVC